MEVDGAEIQRLRIDKGLSQEQLAFKAGYTSQCCISYVENGKKIPRADKFARIAKTLGVKMERLIKGGVANG